MKSSIFIFLLIITVFKFEEVLSFSIFGIQLWNSKVQQQQNPKIFTENKVQCNETLLRDSFPGHVDLVHSLPNVNLPLCQNYSSLGHYSGYLKTLTPNKFMHYWFFKSQTPGNNNWKAEPVILWLGGYVSALNGALTGISPIRMNTNGTLSLNPHSWNRRANLLFFEILPNVGIHSNYEKDYNNYVFATRNDNDAVRLTVKIIESFLEKFPYLTNNEFYIAGEGYVSYHIGILGKLLVEKKYPENFRGIMIGNGAYNMTETVNAHLQFVYEAKKDLHERNFWDNFTKSCCSPEACSSNGCTFRECRTVTYEELNLGLNNESTDCFKFYHQNLTRFYFDLNLDLHNIQEKCVPGVREPTCRRYAITKKIYDWFNRSGKETLKALNADKLYAFWEVGHEWINYYFMRQYPTLHGHLMFLLRNNIRVLLYTGEEDGISSYYNTKWLLDDLSLTPNTQPHKWDFEGETAGTRQSFCEGLTHYSVKGAGHTVAEDRPAQALKMVNEFLFGDHSTNSLSPICPKIGRDCNKFCSTDPSPAKQDRFFYFWMKLLNRYFCNYITSIY